MGFGMGFVLGPPPPTQQWDQGWPRRPPPYTLGCPRTGARQGKEQPRGGKRVPGAPQEGKNTPKKGWMRPAGGRGGGPEVTTGL